MPEDRFAAPDAGVVIGDALVLAVAAFVYEGPMRRALAALKYTGAARVAQPLADAARPALERLLAVAGPVPLVPVPVHAERRRSRGYNQAELIAHCLGGRDLPVRPLLRRVRHTTKQHRLDRTARLRNMRGAFEPMGPSPASVVLVDDIMTTTATLEACAMALRAAGAADVYGFAIAREV
jgi:ComF family protein